MATSVRVIARFRPFNNLEIAQKTDRPVYRISGNNVQELDPKTFEGKQTFTFDHVFGMDSTQVQLYEAVGKPTLEDVLNGFNGTIFCYGQTGTGKTFTMYGPGSGIGDCEEDMQGLVPRATRHIFDAIESGCDGTEYTIKCSYLEIYKEQICCLLTKRENLKVREAPNKGVFVADAAEECVTCPQDVYDLLKIGGKNRHVAATKMNDRSSRSHTVFVISVHQSMQDGSQKSGKLNLVDLAGSERIQKTGASGSVLEEAKKINQSLSALGNCVNALSEGKGGKHIPFRDSKLTRMLQQSLGGNCKTTLVIGASPHVYNYEETFTTLKFGQRAKSIKTSAKCNEKKSPEELLRIIDALQAEIRRLKGVLKENGIKVEGGTGGGSGGGGGGGSGGDEGGDSAGGSEGYDPMALATAQAELAKMKEEHGIKVADLEEEVKKYRDMYSTAVDEAVEHQSKTKEAEIEIETEREAHKALVSQLRFELEQKEAEIEGLREVAEGVSAGAPGGAGAGDAPQDYTQASQPTTGRLSPVPESALNKQIALFQRQLKEVQEERERSREEVRKLQFDLECERRAMKKLKVELEKTQDENDELRSTRTRNTVAKTRTRTTAETGVLNNFRNIGSGQLAMMKATEMEGRKKARAHSTFIMNTGSGLDLQAAVPKKQFSSVGNSARPSREAIQPQDNSKRERLASVWKSSSNLKRGKSKLDSTLDSGLLDEDDAGEVSPVASAAAAAGPVRPSSAPPATSDDKKQRRGTGFVSGSINPFKKKKKTTPSMGAFAEGDEGDDDRGEIALDEVMNEPIGDMTLADVGDDPAKATSRAQSIGRRIVQSFSRAPKSEKVKKTVQASSEDLSTYRDALAIGSACDLSEIEDLKIFFEAGTDHEGRTVFVLLWDGLPMPLDELMLEKVFLHIIVQMDEIAMSEPYVVVSVHEAKGQKQPVKFGWLYKKYRMLPRAYKKNLKGFYLVNPSIGLRAMFKFLTPFLSEKFWQKLGLVDCIDLLYANFGREQVPRIAVEYLKNEITTMSSEEMGRL